LTVAFSKKWKFSKFATDDHIKKVLSAPTPVVKLSFFENLILTDAALDWDVSNFPHLTHVDLARCLNLTDAGTKNLLTLIFVLTCLLRLKEVGNVDEIGDSENFWAPGM
jgi:hypothetical protein